MLKNRHLCILSQKLSIYRRYFHKSKYMCFFYKCDGIWETISNTIKKEFNSEIIHSKKYLKMEKASTQRRLPLYLYISNIN